MSPGSSPTSAATVPEVTVLMEKLTAFPLEFCKKEEEEGVKVLKRENSTLLTLAPATSMNPNDSPGVLLLR